MGIFVIQELRRLQDCQFSFFYTKLRNLSRVTQLVSLHSCQRYQPWATDRTPVTSLTGSFQIPLALGSVTAPLRNSQGHGGQKYLSGFMANGRDSKVTGAGDSLRHIHLYQGLRERSLRCVYTWKLQGTIGPLQRHNKAYIRVYTFPFAVFL